MIRGIGVDILSADRMERPLKNEVFCERVFSSAERAYIAEKKSQAPQSAAGIFCAKEAFAKAVGTGMTKGLFTELEVAHDEKGKPYYKLHGSLAEIYSDMEFFLSITHDRGIAVAVAIAQSSAGGK